MTDLHELIDEISPENPCGEYLEYDPAYLELTKNIAGKPEDFITGEKAQPPNWRDIQKEALALLKRTKDLQIVLYLLRALIPLEGIAGFRDGLNLLTDLLEKYWDDIHPVLDPDDNFDPTMRVNILEELSNFESVLKPLTLAVLVDSKSVGRFCLRDIHLATDKIELPEGSSKPDINIIKAAFLDIPAESLKAAYQAAIESGTFLARIDNFFSEKVGVGSGPDLAAIKSLVKEIRYAFEQFAGAELAGDSGQTSETSEAAEGEPAVVSAAPRQQAGVAAIASRQDVIKTLDLICKYYADNEPSSPVPIFLQRARYLVTADFMEIVQNLLPDAISQLQLIKGPDSDQD
ncbi:MAG: type VI secretion system protein TssA [Methylomonas sp.]